MSIKSVIHFFTDDLWDIDFLHLPFLRRQYYSLCRIVTLAVRGFIGDKCTLYSSALTYITLIAIVPTLAFTLSFCKMWGLQRHLLDYLGLRPTYQKTEYSQKGMPAIEVSYEVVTNETAKAAPKPADNEKSRKYSADEIKPGLAADLPEPMQLALVNVFTYADKTNFAAVGIIGLATLLCTIIFSIQKLEKIFNIIWRISKIRPLRRQICEYLIVLLFMPIIMLCVITIQGFITSGQLYTVLHISSPQAVFVGKIIAQLLVVGSALCAFTFLYMFMPNTNVRLSPAFFGGLVGGLGFCVILYAYIRWQIGLAKFNAIYGSFAALPFFLGWLYTTWLVVLLGAEISYAAQNHRILRFDKTQNTLEPGACHLLGILITHEICTTFNNGKGPWNAAQFAATHSISITELEIALAPLRNEKLILQVDPDTPPPKCYDYVPAKPPNLITLHDVAEAFTRLDSPQARRFGKNLPEALKTTLITHHKRVVAELNTPFDSVD